MSSKLFRDISASSTQVLVNQLAGLGVFLLTSFYLPKDVYGELNWSLAIVTFATTVLSLRLEQVLVKKAATSSDVAVTMTLFLLHVLFSGLIFWLLLFFLSQLFPAFFSVHHLLLWMGASQLLSFFSSPFKQVANGMERFGSLALMSSIANMVRAIALLILVVFSTVTTTGVVIIFIMGSVVELMVSYFIVTDRMQIQLTGKIRFSDYTALLHESLPQIGNAILMAGIARMDWILLGLFSTAALTADYSFAYRVYELSPVPLLIIAPILLSRFSRFFATDNEKELAGKKESLTTLVRIEMILATFIPLLLNICWIPLLEPLSGGKYGVTNAIPFLILSFCTPFQYASNIFWTISFAQNKLKQIFLVTTITFFVILTGDLLLIPYYSTTGAACVYLGAMVIEYLNYMRLTPVPALKRSWIALSVCILAAIVAGLVAMYFFDALLIQLVVAAGLYLLLVLATAQLKGGDLKYIIHKLKNRQDQPA